MGRKSLDSIYRKMESVVVPRLRNSNYHYQAALNEFVGSDLQWLDLGCGHQILPDWMPKVMQEWERDVVGKSKLVVGIDYDLPSLKLNHSVHYKIKGSICGMPFRDNAFDLITSNMVLEHVEHPHAAFAEARRVLKPGGIFLFHTPNLLNYATLISAVIPDKLKTRLIRLLDGRGEEDAFPTYYRTNTLLQIRRLAEINGFDVLRLVCVSSNAETASLGPAALVELLVIRLLQFDALKGFRPSIIAVLQKPNE